MDEYAYFAEGYGLIMNEEQKDKVMIFLMVRMLKDLKNFYVRKSYTLDLKS